MSDSSPQYGIASLPGCRQTKDVCTTGPDQISHSDCWTMFDNFWYLVLFSFFLLAVGGIMKFVLKSRVSISSYCFQKSSTERPEMAIVRI